MDREIVGQVEPLVRPAAAGLGRIDPGPPAHVFERDQDEIVFGRRDPVERVARARRPHQARLELPRRRLYGSQVQFCHRSRDELRSGGGPRLVERNDHAPVDQFGDVGLGRNGETLGAARRQHVGFGAEEIDRALDQRQPVAVSVVEDGGADRQILVLVAAIELDRLGQ